MVGVGPQLVDSQRPPVRRRDGARGSRVGPVRRRPRPARAPPGRPGGGRAGPGAWPRAVTVGVPGGTVEETAWATYSLLLAGEDPWSGPVVSAIEWLLDNQEVKGSWRPSPVGLYFDDLCYNDDLIAHTYTVRALARWRRLADPAAYGDGA